MKATRIILAAALLIPGVEAVEREWENTDGKVIPAHFVYRDDTHVELKTLKNRLFRYPIEKLSEKSRAMLEDAPRVGAAHLSGRHTVAMSKEFGKMMHTFNVRFSHRTSEARLVPLKVYVIGLLEKADSSRQIIHAQHTSAKEVDLSECENQNLMVPSSFPHKNNEKLLVWKVFLIDKKQRCVAVYKPYQNKDLQRLGLKKDWFVQKRSYAWMRKSIL